MSRLGFDRQLVCTVGMLLGVIFALSFGSGREAQARYASIVIDAQTGQVLAERNADDENRPASLAKMMTLYLTFEAVRQGRITMATALPVSETAAARPPSKLGLLPGEMVSVHDLVLALVTKSANDAATVLAEGLAGREPLFTELMTEKAQALGMRRTAFQNASGLPDPQQFTTARDLAVLARALWRDFPEEYRLFATERFEWHGAVYLNHNMLMSQFAGMDGIKTGYIRESGFNLAASAVRNGRRLIGVVMGGDTAAARDTHMARLLEDAFAGRSSEEEIDVAARQDGIGVRLGRVIAALSPIGRAEAAASMRGTRAAAVFGRFRSKAEATQAAAAFVAKQQAGTTGKPASAAAAHGHGRSAAWQALVIVGNAASARLVCETVLRRGWPCKIKPSPF